MSNEGRLSPEELDGLLDPQSDRPSPDRLDATFAIDGASESEDTLASGEDRPTWTSRATGPVRRHPRRTAAVVVVVLLAGLGWQGYVRTRPPPLDTRLATTVWFTPSAVDQQGMSIDGDRAVSHLHLQLPAGISSVTVVALLAPGLGPSTVTQVGPDVTVSNPLDCTGIDNLSGPLGLPVVKLTRTDAWGRTVSATLPTTDSPGTAAIPASVVASALRQTCVGRIADALTVLTVASHPGPAGSPSTLELRVANPTRNGLLVFGAQATFQPPDASLGSATVAPDPTASPPSATLVPAHTTVPVLLTVRRSDCGVGVPDTYEIAAIDSSRRAGDFTLLVAPPLQVPDDAFDNGTSLTLSPAQRASVVTTLAAPCVGAPRLGYTSTASVDPGRNVTFHLSMRTSAGNVDLRTPDFNSNGLGITSWGTSVSWSGPEVTASVTAASMDCSTVFSQLPPPSMPATVRTSRGTYPYLIVLGSAQVLQALSRSCHQSVDLDQARANGWAV